jgi:hypothetical protein
MRIGLAAGSVNRGGTKLLIASRKAAPPFPGPWRVAAVIRIGSGAEAGSPGYAGGDSDALASRSLSSAS